MRTFLFKDWPGCSNHGCLVTGPKAGIGTNGSCTCLVNAPRARLQLLQGRLAELLSHNTPPPQTLRNMTAAELAAHVSAGGALPAVAVAKAFEVIEDARYAVVDGDEALAESLLDKPLVGLL